MSFSSRYGGIRYIGSQTNMLSGKWQNISLTQLDPPLGSENIEMSLSLPIFLPARFSLLNGRRYL
jgi:hypothetical protein